MDNVRLNWNGEDELLDLTKVELIINESNSGATNIMTLNCLDYKYTTELLSKIVKEARGTVKVTVGIDELIPETEVIVSSSIFVSSRGIRKDINFSVQQVV